MRNIGRREFLIGAAATASSLLTACSWSGKSGRRTAVSDEKQVNVYSWADYIDPQVIPEFEKRYGIRVVYDTFASNESLLAKLQTGASDYDVIVPTSYLIHHLSKLKLIRPLDHNRLTNFKNISTRFTNPPFDPECRHTVPYTWGTTGIGFNQNAFSRGEFPDSTDVFWDKKLAGRMTLLDDARETIGMSLKRLGHSYNTTDEGEIRQAFDDLKIQKPLTMSYTSDQVIVQLASGDSLLSLVYSGDAYQAVRDNKDIRYVIPTKGTSLWVDNLAISESAPHEDNAYLWLNFLLEPEIAAANSNYTRYSTPNEKALSKIEPELLADKNLYPSDKVLDRCDQIGDIGSLLFLYDRLWTELKCS